MSARIPREKVHSLFKAVFTRTKKMEQSKRRSGLKLHGACTSKVEWSRGEERGQSWPLLANRLVACLPPSPLLSWKTTLPCSSFPQVLMGLLCASLDVKGGVEK